MYSFYKIAVLYGELFYINLSEIKQIKISKREFEIF